MGIKLKLAELGTAQPQLVSNIFHTLKSLAFVEDTFIVKLTKSHIFKDTRTIKIVSKPIIFLLLKIWPKDVLNKFLVKIINQNSCLTLLHVYVRYSIYC